MAKLKTAILRAQEMPVTYVADEIMLRYAREALTAAIQRPEEGLASAEKALHLINAYLMERPKPCKQ
jgi:hypothetical protein